MAAAIAIALLLAAAAPDGAGPPTREDFLAEALFPEPSENTARFGADAPESYRPDKIDLLRNLPGFARARGAGMRSLLVFGPNGPKKAYTVIVVVSRGEEFRMNAVLTQGAKIVRKGTAGIAPDALARFIREISRSSVVVEAGSSPEDLEGKLGPPPKDGADSRFDFLLAVWSPEGGPVVFFADLHRGERSAVESLLRSVNVRLRALDSTFPER
jgi:hypothetical protein